MSALDDCLNLNQQHDYADWMRLYSEARTELATLRAELAEYRTLRPTKCRPACWRKGWDAAREAAALNTCYRCRDSVPLTVNGEYHVDGVPCLSCEIRALVPPADCGVACNPLEPDKLVDDLADALNDLRDKMGAEAWNKFVEMSHR